MAILVVRTTLLDPVDPRRSYELAFSRSAADLEAGWTCDLRIKQISRRIGDPPSSAFAGNITNTSDPDLNRVIAAAEQHMLDVYGVGA